MKKAFVLIFMILASTELQSQFIEKRSTEVSIGLGMSAPYGHMDVLRSPGFYAQGEYVLSPARWIDFRPYAGLILTKLKEIAPEQVQARYRSSANAVLLGGKTRISAPVPFFAPYFEIGMGVSLGSFETYTPTSSIEKNGVLLHIPFSLGFELGRQHNVNVKITYYFHNNLEQFTGAVAIGLSFPMHYY